MSTLAACVAPGSMTEPGNCLPPTPTITNVVPPPVSHLIPVHVVPHVASLPFTGADVMELLAVGVAAILAGTLLRYRRRTVA